MKGGAATRLAELRPEIKQRWAALLRAKSAPPPPSAALFRRETLLFKLDDTLARLADSLAGPAARRAPPRAPAPFDERRGECQCGLHLLRAYYRAGAQALRITLPAEDDPFHAAVMRQFNQLAQEEIKLLGEVCCHRGGERCGLRPARERATAFGSAGR